MNPMLLQMLLRGLFGSSGSPPGSSTPPAPGPSAYTPAFSTQQGNASPFLSMLLSSLFGPRGFGSSAWGQPGSPKSGPSMPPDPSNPRSTMPVARSVPGVPEVQGFHGSMAGPFNPNEGGGTSLTLPGMQHGQPGGGIGLYGNPGLIGFPFAGQGGCSPTHAGGPFGPF